MAAQKGTFFAEREQKNFYKTRYSTSPGNISLRLPPHRHENLTKQIRLETLPVGSRLSNNYVNKLSVKDHRNADGPEL